MSAVDALMSPACVFGVDHERNATSWSARMRPGPWMADADGHVIVGSIGVLTDIALSMPGFLAGAAGGLARVSVSIAIDAIPGFDWSGGELRADAELIHRDDRHSLTRGVIRSETGEIGAIATLTGRYLPAPPDLDVRYSTAGRPRGSSQTVTDLLGAPVRAQDEASLELCPGQWAINPRGVVHGGVLLTLADAVAVEALPGGAADWTMSGIRISYLRPTPTTQQLRAKSVPTFIGRGTAHSRATVHAGGDGLTVTADLTHVRRRSAGEEVVL